jgi:hypothetical protein
LAHGAPLAALNALAEEAQIRTESNHPVRFVAPAERDRYYEVRVFESGRVETRPDNLHDLFNALAWLAFPRTKARINAMHAVAIPRESGRRGRLRDLLTIFDEGGVIAQTDDATLVEQVRAFRWKELFWDRREEITRAMRLIVLGHAVLEQALEPWPGITCKAVFIQSGDDPDAAGAAWLAGLSPDASPKEMPPLPIFGFPGWSAGNEQATFYDDTRYFRPLRRDTR